MLRGCIRQRYRCECSTLQAAARFAPDLVHLSVPGAGVFSAVIRVCAGRLKVLYARTSFIETLGIKGGGTERPIGTPGRRTER